MGTLHIGPAAILLVSAIGLAACDDPQSGSVSTAARDVSEAAQTAGAGVADAAQAVGAGATETARQTSQAIGDTAITTKIKAAILADTELELSEISVETYEGLVTLTGNVDSEANRDNAVSIASRTDGVRSVSNRLSVNPED